MKKYTLLFFTLTVLLICTLLTKAQTQFTSNLRGNGLCFTENKGQIADMSGKLRPDVLYRGEGGGADIYLRKTGISYVYNNLKKVNQKENGEVLSSMPDNFKPQTSNLKLHRVDIDFVNCNSNISVSNEDELEGYNNYYLAHCPKGVTHVKQYNKVIYKDIYSGIDVAYYGNKQKGLEYDIIVNPNGDISLVKLNWTGAEDMYINSSGNLVIKTSVNEFYVSIPKAYQEINSKKVLVDARYVLTSNSSLVNGQLVTFKIGKHNPAFPLIIDPLTWITYFGGSEEDLGIGVATDRQHNVIFCGYTESPDLPVSVGAFHVALDGLSDGFIAKFDANGARLWATYFGGSAKDECRGGIAIDSNNNIFVTSVTWSTDFPGMAWGGAFMQLVNHSPNNGTAYVAQFTPAGALTWSTYYGGSGADWGTVIAIDGLQDIIIAGNTSSADFPVEAAYQPAISGGQDAYIVKFNNLGVRQWATFYGGSNTEAANGIVTDAANNIYVSGTTSSDNFPVVAAYQGANAGGANDAFLVKLNTANGNPLWSTYYGGSADDQGADVVADALGNVFLGLKTASGNNISTAGSYQPALKGSYDGGVVKFTGAGARVWGTYIGGSQSDDVSGLAVDMNNNISVAGSTSSSNFPVTACAFETTYGGSGDEIMAKFNQQGQLLCSTYINNCSAFSIAVDGVYAYINGGSGGNLPVTAGVFQSVYAGTGDAAFVKLCSYSCDTTGGVKTKATFVAAPASPCAGAPVNFTVSNTSCDTANTTYSWTFTGGTPASSAAQNPSGITWNTSGAYGLSVQVVSPCDSAVTITNNLTVNATATTIIPNGPTTFCYGDYVILTASAANSYMWSNGDTTQSITVFTSGTYSVNVADTGCSGSSNTITVTVNPIPPTPVIIVHNDTLYCSTDSSYASYQWYFNDSIIQGATKTYYLFPTGGNYDVDVTDTDGCHIAVGINVLTGLNEIVSNPSFYLYPNPTGNELIIKSGELIIENVEIYDVLSNKVNSQQSEIVNRKSEISIDVSLLPAGIYFLQLRWEGGSVAKKFVKE